MPYKNEAARRLANRERQRKWRERQRAKKKAEQSVVALPVPDDPVGELAQWAKEKLVVPSGHPAAGSPMALPEYAEEFLRAGWNAHESACSVSRKNAKSAACAILCLGFLVGPLRVQGWRGSIASLSVEKAGELRKQVADIAIASKLGEINIRRSPYPGAIESSTGCLDTLSADRSSGHAAGYDLVVVDETGLFPERSRELLAGLRSSISAKGGRIIHISVQGDSPLFQEILDNPETVSRVYAAPEGCAIDDEEAWRAANPTLGQIKQLNYMRMEVRRIKSAPGDEPSFRAYDLNQKLSPTREMIFTPSDLKKCIVDELPPRQGPVCLGFDAGGSTSATACFGIWPQTGRAEAWMAFGDNPPIADRARADNAPYVQMVRRGELKIYPGRTTPQALFLGDVAADLAGCKVHKIAADSYDDARVSDVIDMAGLNWPREFRRVGAGKDGGRDIRALQRVVMGGRLMMKESLAFAWAIRMSTIRRDANGNPGLDKATSKGRIDLLSAAVIAAGMAEAQMDRPSKPSWRYAGMAG